MPQWWGAGAALQSAGDYHFLPLSWEIDGQGRIVPPPQQECEARRALRFYGDAVLGAGDAVALYGWLHTSAFCSLYGATSVFEDFAETFAGFVHVLMLENMHSVRVALPGRPALTIDDYWQSSRSADKRRFMQRFLGVS